MHAMQSFSATVVVGQSLIWTVYGTDWDMGACQLGHARMHTYMHMLVNVMYRYNLSTSTVVTNCSAGSTVMKAFVYDGLTVSRLSLTSKSWRVCQ